MTRHTSSPRAAHALTKVAATRSAPPAFILPTKKRIRRGECCKAAATVMLPPAYDETDDYALSFLRYLYRLPETRDQYLLRYPRSGLFHAQNPRVYVVRDRMFSLLLSAHRGPTLQVAGRATGPAQ